MIVVGLTGSIGMGKSTTAQMFAEEGVPVYDADAAVHDLYAKGGAAVGPLAALIPGVVEQGAVNRDALREAVFENPDLLSEIEAITHPLVWAAREDFLRENSDAPIVLLDIPLLFETGGDRAVDKIVVVTAPPEVQRERVLARPDMSVERFETILAKQTPDAEKRERADFIVDTSDGMETARGRVAWVLSLLRAEADRERDET